MVNPLAGTAYANLSPDELKLVIIDPKRLEFTAYHDIPHLLFPVITQPSKAAPVLAWLTRVMEERYEKMAQKNVRNIGEYKKMCKSKNQEDDMPYIVVIIDELADLMIIARKEIEESIARLAQMARAAGIHLILATQRPSVDVLTGVIKVNFPSRIAFRVSSKIDSRTIIDAPGAEKLLGKGDMLFMDAHSAGMRRVHGAYITDTEISSIVEFIKKQRPPEYIDLQTIIAQHTTASLQDNDDPLLQEVIKSLEFMDELSISSLQRKFSIGYNRSARLVEHLEAMGYILPADGSKMRKIIK
jgi:S-DNA-T family DNA segregation ATPase FtsK/SpoIIIE